jgi:hypothetical protein
LIVSMSSHSIGESTLVGFGAGVDAGSPGLDARDIAASVVTFFVRSRDRPGSGASGAREWTSVRAASWMGQSAAPSASHAVEGKAVIALRQDAGQVSGQGVGGHRPACPRRIPYKEDGQAGERAPVSDFGSARFEEELREVRRIARAEFLLGKASEPRRAIGEPGLPFVDGEPTAV